MLVICGLLTVLEPKPPYFCSKTVELLYSAWQRVPEKGSKKIPGHKICHLWEALVIKRCFSDLGKEHVFRRHFSFFRSYFTICFNFTIFQKAYLILSSGKCSMQGWKFIKCRCLSSLVLPAGRSLCSFFSKTPLLPKGPSVCQNVPHPGDQGM